jgi:hypothetical protein
MIHLLIKFGGNGMEGTEKQRIVFEKNRKIWMGFFKNSNSKAKTKTNKSASGGRKM